MKKLAYIIMLFAAITANAQSGGIQLILDEIEQNNPTLRAIRQEVDAQKLSNRTGVFLENPEVEYNHLWGDPTSMGHRNDVRISQPFDFPTVYANRSKLAKAQNSQAEIQYDAARMDILLEAKLYCIDAEYYRTVIAEMENRLRTAESLAEATSVKLRTGDGTVMEENKARLNLVAVRNEIELNKVELDAALAGLKRLNGGKAIDFAGDMSTGVLLPDNTEEWTKELAVRNPSIRDLIADIEVSRREIQLNRSASLPKFSAGFMSEKVVGEHFKGVTVSMSIPLWENRNTVRAARARYTAAQSLATAEEQKYTEELRILYDKAQRLSRIAENGHRSLESFVRIDLLEKALDAGEISVLDYLVETGLYYEVMDQTLSATRELRRTLAELTVSDL